jgi:hypothetical protein
MTGDQKSALEKVVGRVLTTEEITALGPLLDIRNDVEIARLLSLGRTRQVPTQVGVGTVMAAMGERGGAFLDAVTSLGVEDRQVYWGFDPVRRAVLDLSVPVARTMLAALRTKLPAYADDIDQLLVLGAEPDPIDFNRISDALNVAEGRMTL